MSIDEALDDAAFKSLFDKVAFLSKKRKLVIERAIHTNHYLDTEIRHHVNGRYTHSTHTGPVFQRRTTERKKQEIESSVQDFPPEAIQEQQKLQGRRAFLNDFKASLKDRLKSFAAIQANHKGLLAALIKGLGEAGLSDEDIGAILSQDEVQNLIDFSSTYDQLEADGRKKLQTSLPEVGSFLNGITAQAQRLSLPVWQWAQRNGPEFVEGVCNLAILASRYTSHPAVAVPARVCTLGQMAPRAVQKLEQAQAFFSKKHEGTTGKGKEQNNISTSSKESRNLLWSSWKEYPKIVKDGKEYAVIGDRLYTSHAVDRMQPSGLGAREGGDKGRSFPPNLIDKVIRQGEKRVSIKGGKERTIHSMGSAEVITEESGSIVVTVNPFRGGY